MFAGLPGTGIGGIFYLLLTIWMPINEAYLTVRGRSSLERWRFVAVRVTLFALVIAVMWVQVEILRGIFPQGAPAAGAALARTVGDRVGVHVSADTSAGLLLASALYAGIVMASVIFAVHMVRVVLWYRVRFAELAYQEDFAGEWKRFKHHLSERGNEFAIAATDVRNRFRAVTRRRTPRYR